ncbi:MAG: DUF1638 domain-containing protein [Verrucomicrobia bacterium]|jgi:hypothetical protein|nr:DUF1638 domain-containing protein [Verrucomicrobiota bacterium]
MRLSVLCCEVFYREICSLVATSPHQCDVQFLPKGLHDLGSEKMSARLQECLDAVDSERYDAIALVYGLCNNGTVGIQAPGLRIVIPKAHDCIALFMGSRSRYREYFDAHPGTYYRTSGWLERDDTSGAADTTIPQQLGLSMSYQQLVDEYGEDNAKYVMEMMGDGEQHYDRLAFIRMGIEGEDRFRDQSLAEASRKQWTFDEIEGDMSILRKLVYGEWDDDFLVLAPGSSLVPSYDEQVVKPQEA